MTRLRAEISPTPRVRSGRRRTCSSRRR